MKHGSGFLLLCPNTGRILLGLRNDPIHVWANFGGTIERYESPLQAAKREFLEEAGFVEDTHYSIVSNRPVITTQYGYFTYKCYVAVCNVEHTPKLNYEHLEFGWFALDAMPTDLHFGFKDIIHSDKVLKKIQKIMSGSIDLEENSSQAPQTEE